MDVYSRMFYNILGNLFWFFNYISCGNRLWQIDLSKQIFELCVLIRQINTWIKLWFKSIHLAHLHYFGEGLDPIKKSALPDQIGPNFSWEKLKQNIRNYIFEKFITHFRKYFRKSLWCLAIYYFSYHRNCPTILCEKWNLSSRLMPTAAHGAMVLKSTNLFLKAKISLKIYKKNLFLPP